MKSTYVDFSKAGANFTAFDWLLNMSNLNLCPDWLKIRGISI